MSFPFVVTMWQRWLRDDKQRQREADPCVGKKDQRDPNQGVPFPSGTDEDKIEAALLCASSFEKAVDSVYEHHILKETTEKEIIYQCLATMPTHYLVFSCKLPESIKYFDEHGENCDLGSLLELVNAAAPFLETGSDIQTLAFVERSLCLTLSCHFLDIIHHTLGQLNSALLLAQDHFNSHEFSLQDFLAVACLREFQFIYDFYELIWMPLFRKI